MSDDQHDPAGTPDEPTGGKTAGGESNGGAYPNPHTGKKPEGGGFMGHGGQTEIAYSGTGDDGTDAEVGNPNAVTKE